MAYEPMQSGVEVSDNGGRRSLRLLLTGWIRQAVLATAFACVSLSAGAIQFTDVTQASGVDFTGESFGASWGDYNGDGLPDLFVNHHRDRNSVWVNQGDATFVDRSFEVDLWETPEEFADVHGAAWGDYDNDGDQDLLISAGAKDSSQFFQIDNGIWQSQILDFSFEVPTRPGRLPLWFDFTQDGLLDMALMNRGVSRVVEQTLTDFVDVRATTGFDCTDNQYGQLGDLNMDGRIDILCVSTNFPDKIYDFGTIPFGDVTTLVPSTVNPVDSVLADFDGDGFNDIVMLRGRVRISGSEAVSANAAQAHLLPTIAHETGVTFESNGDVTFVLHWSARNVADVHIGAGDIQPPFPAPGEPISFTLSSTDPAIQGMVTHDPAVNRGIYVGYDSTTSTWTYLSSAGPQTSFSYTYTFIDSTGPITNLVEVGLQGIDLPSTPVLFTSGSGSLVDTSAAAGFTTQLACSAVTAADFDNDMDVDIFFGCRNGVSNRANLLYLNDGAGVFTAAPVFGAEGPIGPGVGLTESAVAGDYDSDGFVDLFVTNGLKLFPEKPFVYAGSDKLFRNAGNGNHWAQFDLVGTTSNRDAIGAKVTVHAGGISQVRERNGGYHRWSQDLNHRLHVGLGSNTTFDIDVTWPDGTIESYTNLAADLVYEIEEGVNATIKTIPTSVPPSTCESVGGGAPAYDLASDRGVYVWRDCEMPESWHVRVLAGDTGPIEATGQIIATQDLLSVDGQSIEASDVLDTTIPTEVSYDLEVGVGSFDGFDLTFPPGTEVCFRLDLPAGTPVLVGYAQTLSASAFDLTTLGACTNVLPAVSVGPAIAQEDSGVANVPVSLSQPSTQTVTATYITNDNSALSPDDYDALSGLVTFLPGQILVFVDVVLNDDVIAEGAENFVLLLSNPTNAVLGTAAANITIEDDEPSSCGPVLYDASTEQAAFVFRDCVTDTWSVRVTAGGGNATYVGSLVSEQILSSVLPYSLEASDLFDTTDPTTVSFSLIVGGTGTDGFDFTVSPGAQACFDLDLPVGMPVFVGAARAPLTTPVNLLTQTSCSAVTPELTVQPVVVDEDVNPQVVLVDVTLSALPSVPVTVDFATLDYSALAGQDYVHTSGSLTFAVGDTLETISIDLLDDSLSEGTETFGLDFSNLVNATLDPFQGAITIADDEVSPCGVNPFDPNTQAGVFLYQDCTSEMWSLRISGGGGSFMSYQGSLTADQPFSSIAGVSLEVNDVLDTSAGDIIDFSLGAGGSGIDGVDFTVAALPGACLRLTGGAATSAFVGDTLTAINTPFDLGTLGPCLDVVPDISVDNPTVAENILSQQLHFTITLAQPSGQTVSVDYATRDVSAVDPDDYVTAFGTAVFTPGETTVQVPITLVDDGIAEGDEELALDLSGAMNGVVVIPTGTGTILDNEVLTLASIADVSADETGSVMTFAISLNIASAQTVSVDITTFDDSALAGEDYTSTSDTLVFLPGSILETFDVPILDDVFSEGGEAFGAALTNPVNVTLGDAEATGTINDDEPSPCGIDNIDAATDVGIFVWRDCGTDLWHLRVAEAGGSWQVSAGNLEGAIAFANVTGFSLEGGDVLDNTTPSLINFSLGVGGTGIDGFDFEHPSGRDICVTVDTPPGRQVLLGASRTPISPPFDLATLAPCTQVTPEISVAANINTTEDEVSGIVSIDASLSAPSVQVVTVEYTSGDSSAMALDDYLADAGILTFNPGEVSKSIDITLVNDNLSEGVEDFTVTLSNPINGTLGMTTTAIVTIDDDEASPCGPAVFDNATEQGVFIYRLCGSDTWSVRISGGGSAFDFYAGSVTAPAPIINVSGYSLEASDTLDTSVPTAVGFSLGVGGTGVDGIDFDLSAPAGACFSLDAPLVPVYLGADKTPMLVSFELETLQICP